MIVNAQVSIGDTFGGIQGSFGDIVSVIINIVFVVAGVTVLFLFLFGGIKTILSAGQSDPRGASQGKSAVTAAITGFIIVFASYWIVRLIEVITSANLITNLGF